MRAIAIALLLTACAGSREGWMRQQTAGNVSCAESEIVVRDTGSSMSLAQWTATCPNGATYHCAKGTGETRCTRAER